MSALLKAEDLELAYGEIAACRSLSFSIDEGEIVALIGANGAGKSTTLRAVAGALIPRVGVIRFGSADITRLPSLERTQLGLALVPEGRRVFPFPCFRGCASGPGKTPARFRVASSRCWRSAAR